MKSGTSAVALSAAVFIQMIGVGLIVALLPSRVIDISNSMDYVGYLASAFAVPFVLFQLPVGHLGDRYGFKIFLMAGYIVSFLTGLLYFKAGNVLSILCGRALQGISEIPVWALAPALLSLLFRESKGEAIGKYNASLHLGLTTGSMISVYIFTVWSGNEPFLFYSATGLIAAIIIAFFVKEPAKNCKGLKQNSTSYSNILHALKEIRRPAIYTGICLYGGSYGVFITVIPGVLLREKAFSQSEVGLFFALFYIAISISQVFAGKLSDRHGRNVTMVMGLLLVMTGLAPFMFFTGKGILAALFLASFGLGMFCVSSLALLNEAVPDSLKGSISGLFYLLWGIGYFLFPPLMANLGRYLDFHMLFPILSFVVLAELIALAWKPGIIRDSS